MTFVGRLIVGTILVVLAAIVAMVVGADYTLRRDLQDDLRRGLEREARLAVRALPADSQLWQESAEEIARQNGHRLTVIDTAGRVRAESSEPADTISHIENQSSAPEVKEALAGRVGSSLRTSALLGQPLLYVAVPGGPGAIRVAASLDPAYAIVRRAQRSILFAAIIALIVGMALAGIAGRSIARPLISITQAARSIAQGAAPRFPRSGIPDIDALVRALRDMHEQLEQRFEELRRERAESAALVEAMVEGVIAADGRGRTVTANAAARRLLGYAEGEALPALDQLFRVKSAREAVAAVLAGQAIAGRELELDGHVVLLSARPLSRGGALLVLHDVTEVRRLEAVRRDFVANVSHELKTPLTSIVGYAETLVHDSLADPETTRRFLDVILANAQRMQRLVEDLLDLSRIESGGWHPAQEQLETGAVAREVLGLFTGRASGHGVTLDLSVRPGAEQVHADPDALRQVLTNLLDNALRYTPSGGRITISAARRDGGLALSVKDTGSGITREHLPRIFERFYRADPARSREEGGTGLGLAIVKHLVEAHGGDVQAESEVGAGTTITCWFPDGANGGQ
jgi:signal transduction histidine kinase